MKLSPKTIDLLNSFSTISPHILIKEGSSLRTIDTESNTPFMALATTDDVFEQEFAVYDLPSLMGIVKMFPDPELTFNDDYLNISHGSTNVRYGYTSKNLIGKKHTEIHDNEPKLADTLIEIKITKDALKNTIQAAGLMKLPDISIRSNGNGIEMVARDVELSKNMVVDTNNEYVTDLEVEYSGPSFCANYLAHQMTKIIKADYMGSIGFKSNTSGVLTLNGDGIRYMMASQNTTSYDGDIIV